MTRTSVSPVLPLPFLDLKPLTHPVEDGEVQSQFTQAASSAETNEKKPEPSRVGVGAFAGVRSMGREMSLYSTRNGRMDAAAESVDVGALYGLEFQAVVAPHLEVQARLASGSAQGAGRWDIKDACGCTVTRQDTWVQRTQTADLGLNVYLAKPEASFQPYLGVRAGVAQTQMKAHQGVWSYGDLQSYPDGKAVNAFAGYQAGLKYQHPTSGWYGRLEVSGTTDLRSYSGFSQDNVRLGVEGLSPRALTLSFGRSFGGGKKPAPQPAAL